MMLLLLLLLLLLMMFMTLDILSSSKHFRVPVFRQFNSISLYHHHRRKTTFKEVGLVRHNCIYKF